MTNYLGDYVYRGVVYSKKNSKRIVRNHATGTYMLLPTAKAHYMEAQMSKQFTEQVKDGKEPTDDRVHVHINLYRKDNTKRDLDNTATSVLDGMVQGGILQDDNISCVYRLTIDDRGVDKSDPRVEIKVCL